MKKLFGKKKKEEIVQPEDVPEVPEAEEQEEALPEPQEIEKTKAWLKKNKEAAKKEPKAEPETKGEFSVNMEEMALFAQLAAGSEEYKIYQQGLVGKKLDKIVTEYNKAVGGKSEVPSSEDTDEEALPE